MATKKKAVKKKAAAKKTTAKKTPRPKKAAAVKRASPVPEGLVTVTPNLVVRDAARAIAFYVEALGATELMRMLAPDGRSVWHAEIKIGDAVVFLNDEFPASACRAPTPQHPATASLQLYVPDCDAMFSRAIAAGATVAMPLADMFWGDRMGMFTDPFGVVWVVSTRNRHMTPAELEAANAEALREAANET